MVIVTWNGMEHLGPCLSSLAASDYPADRLEVVVVDNGSTDGTVEWIAREHPRVRVVPLASNQGFTGGNAAGVAAATGDVLVFFNNDMRVEPDTVRRLVTAAADGTACAAARVLSWDGRAIDFLRGTISFEARGFQDYYGEPVTLDRTRATDTFFPNGGAFAVTRAAYDRAGGFDDAFFAYYDDVDLGWRLRLAGLDMRVEDTAVVYHRHGATSRTQPAGQKRFLMERNALWTVVKNYGEDTLRRTLGPVLLLATRRLLDEARIDERAAVLARFAPFSAPRRRDARASTRSIEPRGSAPAPPAAGERLILGLPGRVARGHRRGDRHARRHRAGAAADPGGAARRRARRAAALRARLRVHLELRLVSPDPGGADRGARSPARVHAAAAAADRQPRSHRHQHVGARRCASSRSGGRCRAWRA